MKGIRLLKPDHVYVELVSFSYDEVRQQLQADLQVNGLPPVSLGKGDTLEVKVPRGKDLTRRA